MFLDGTLYIHTVRAAQCDEKQTTIIHRNVFEI
jgi:hypothetical protein